MFTTRVEPGVTGLWVEEGQQRRDLVPAVPHHLQRNIGDDDQADPRDPAVFLDQLGDQIGGEAHQRDRQRQAEQQDGGVIARGGGDGDDVVEAHRQVGEGDLDRGGEEALAPRRAFDGGGGLVIGNDVMVRAKLAEHVVGDPQKQQPAGEQQPGDVEQPVGDQRKADQEHHGDAHPEHDDLAPFLRRKAAGDGAHDDDIVARHGEIDQNHPAKRGEPGGGEDVGEVEEGHGGWVRGERGWGLGGGVHRSIASS